MNITQFLRLLLTSSRIDVASLLRRDLHRVHRLHPLKHVPNRRAGWIVWRRRLPMIEFVVTSHVMEEACGRSTLWVNFEDVGSVLRATLPLAPSSSVPIRHVVSTYQRWLVRAFIGIRIGRHAANGNNGEPPCKARSRQPRRGSQPRRSMHACPETSTVSSGLRGRRRCLHAPSRALHSERSSTAHHHDARPSPTRTRRAIPQRGYLTKVAGVQLQSRCNRGRGAFASAWHIGAK